MKPIDHLLRHLTTPLDFTADGKSYRAVPRGAEGDFDGKTYVGRVAYEVVVVPAAAPEADPVE